MTAAPKNATIILVGRSGRTYVLNAYFSDVANAFATFSTGGKAASTDPTDFTPQEYAEIRDISFESGLTDTAFYQIIINNVETGDVVDKATFDDGIARRPPLRIPIYPNQQLRIKQLA